MKPIIVIFAIAASLPLAASSAADLFKSKCAMCHGADASGNTAIGKKLRMRDLRDQTIQGQSDAQLIAIIENGRDKMPAQKGNLSKDQIKQLVTVIRGLSKGR